MIILNLSYPEKSEIKFISSKFPDGQQQVEIIENIPHENILILTRLNNFLDLEKLICCVKSLNEIKVKNILISIPYFLGSRSDRKFQDGSNHYLKQVICPIINSLNAKKISSLDSHSYVLEACLNNFKHSEIAPFYIWCKQKIDNENILVLSPDSGAVKRTESFCKKINYNNEIFICNKVRNSEGRIVKTTVPNVDLNKDIVIVDDICDGGGTFIEIAKVIRGQNYTGKLSLIVTHGIFSKGFLELSSYFDAIYCTNSYSDISNPDINNKNFIFKQYNLF